MITVSSVSEIALMFSQQGTASISFSLSEALVETWAVSVGFLIGNGLCDFLQKPGCPLSTHSDCMEREVG